MSTRRWLLLLAVLLPVAAVIFAIVLPTRCVPVNPASPAGICHTQSRPELRAYVVLGALFVSFVLVVVAFAWGRPKPHPAGGTAAAPEETKIPRASRARRTAGSSAGIWLVVVGLLTYAAAAVAVRTGPPAWDASAFRALNEVGGTWERVLHIVSRPALPVGLSIVVIGFAAFLVIWTRSAVPLITGIGAGVVAWIVANVAKLIVDRPRPYETIPDAVLRQHPALGTSFPSSHTAVTIAVIVAVLPFLPTPARIIGIGFAVLVAWSRVYLGVHYPLDVIAGAGIGLATGGAAWFVTAKLNRRPRGDDRSRSLGTVGAPARPDR